MVQTGAFARKGSGAEGFGGRFGDVGHLAAELADGPGSEGFGRSFGDELLALLPGFDAGAEGGRVSQCVEDARGFGEVGVAEVAVGLEVR